MKVSRETFRLERLYHSLEEGRITEQECGTLKELLARNAKAREEYVRLTEISVSLRNYAAYERQNKDNLPAYPKIIGFSIAAAAAVILLALGIRHGRVQSPPLQVENGFANIIWTDGGQSAGFTEGDRIGKITLDLSAGERIGISMDGGATISLAGPARMDLLSSKAAYLYKGRTKIRLNGNTRTFSLETDEFRILDLGTEFGVWADPGGPDQAHVMEGAVEVTGTGKARVLNAGEGVSGAGTPLEYRPGLFHFGRSEGEPKPTRRDLLELANGKLRGDKRLVIHFPMDKTTPGRIEDKSGNQGSGGAAAISGAKWVPGRVPGKPALSFSSPGDAVRMDIPGEFDAITLCAWVRIRSLPDFYNAIFASDNFSPGNIHWQVEKTGGMNLGVSWEQGRWSGLYSKSPVAASPAGKWLHLATTFDTRDGKCVHYVNGIPLVELPAEPKPGVKIRIGQASLGNWFDPPRGEEHPLRPWNGEIDSFMFFSEALDAAEIKKLHSDTSASGAEEQ